MATESLQRDRVLKRCDIAFHKPGEPFERHFAYIQAHAAGIKT
jgi:hypothetical protein